MLVNRFLLFSLFVFNNMQWGITALQFILGGMTVVVATLLSNMKGQTGVFLGSMLATIPLQDMIPAVFIDSPTKAESYTLRNAVSNIAVISGMIALFLSLKSNIPKTWCVVIGLSSWLVIAIAAQLIIGAV